MQSRMGRLHFDFIAKTQKFPRRTHISGTPSCNRSSHFHQLVIAPATNWSTAGHTHVVTGSVAQAYMSRSQRSFTQLSPVSMRNHVFLSSRIHDHVQKLTSRIACLRTRRTAQRQCPNTLNFFVRCFDRSIRAFAFCPDWQNWRKGRSPQRHFSLRWGQAGLRPGCPQQQVSFLTVVLTFAATLKTAAFRTRFPGRFLTLSAHFLEMSRLATVAAHRIAQTTLRLDMWRGLNSNWIHSRSQILIHTVAEDSSSLRSAKTWMLFQWLFSGLFQTSNRECFTSVVFQWVHVHLSHKFHPFHPLVFQTVIGSPLELEHLSELSPDLQSYQTVRVLHEIMPFLSLKPCFTISFARPEVVVASIPKRAFTPAALSRCSCSLPCCIHLALSSMISRLDIPTHMLSR